MRKKPSLDLNFKTPESLLKSSSSLSSSKKTPYESYIFKDPQPQIHDFSHITQETHAFIDNSMNSIRKHATSLKSPFENTISQRKTDFSNQEEQEFAFSNRLNREESGFFFHEFENNRKFIEGRDKILRNHRIFELFMSFLAIFFLSYFIKTGFSWIFNEKPSISMKPQDFFWIWLFLALSSRILMFTSKSFDKKL